MFVGLASSTVMLSSTVSVISTAVGVVLHPDNESVKSETIAIMYIVERGDFITTSF